MKDLCKRINGFITGYFMIDEIKLENITIWNSMNNIVTGFIEGESNMKDLMMNVLGLS